jgi:hypothetical protein
MSSTRYVRILLLIAVIVIGAAPAAAAGAGAPYEDPSCPRPSGSPTSSPE